MNKREFMIAYVLAHAGGIDRGFSTHDAARIAGAVYDAIVAATPDPADEGWIEHRGEKPYPEGAVEYVLRSGETGDADSDFLIWTHEDLPGDIIAWRPARA